MPIGGAHGRREGICGAEVVEVIAADVVVAGEDLVMVAAGVAEVDLVETAQLQTQVVDVGGGQSRAVVDRRQQPRIAGE
ncbi:hypothetical protein D9M69_702830 [compost metagenome]